ncbi:MAG: thioesterase domain-containing protein [Candidatus Sulfopaludibacter sp.]|nr:thioesterase domain-containing protein [Candidatus Sulfopaludibacter sp.]
MRILLAQNSEYYPAHGGGDKSNRLLLEALAGRGHACRAVARISVFGETERYLCDLAARGISSPRVTGGVVSFERAGVSVHVVTTGNFRALFTAQIAEFHPDVILTSTDDPAQLLLEAALRADAARAIYLVRATLAVPFGPDCAFPSEAKAERIRSTDAVVCVSQYVADYVQRWSGIPAAHVPISLLEPQEGPLATPDPAGFVTMVNPCAVKGIAIFLALADAFPALPFAAVPTWGTTEKDRADLAARPNVAILRPVDRIDDLLARTRVLVVPSLWAEARSRIVLEALLRGVPVLAANTGGIPEAMMGVPYLLPVQPIAHYQTMLDSQMVPIAEVPRQDIGPWVEALQRLVSDGAHYREISAASRAAARNYQAQLSVEPFERILFTATRHERIPPKTSTLSDEKRKLLALRLRRRAPRAAWFPDAESAEGERLFCFPHAGGGTRIFPGKPAGVALCPARLPGRESRLAEAPFVRMSALIDALAGAIDPYLDRPFAFFGHSMGAAIAFELARELRRRCRPLPRILIASAARAPQYRRDYSPPPPPTDDEFLSELRRLQGIPLDAPFAPSVLLPALRADATLYRNYVYAEDAPLPCPLRAYGGLDDERITREHLEAWGEQTTAHFAVRQFPGGHFYLRQSDAFLRALEEDL